MANVQPAWIGPGNRQLYSVFHRAVTPPESHRVGVVLVPALLHEQPRSRRLTMQIAEHLSLAGLDCLRFDFFGTGDSGGSGMEADFQSMQYDIAQAVDALHQRGTDQVAVLAMRGGTLPTARWLAQGGRAAALVLWEPILDGGAWLDELERADAQELRSPSRYPMRAGSPVATCANQLMGFDVSRRLRDNLAASEVDAASVWRQPTWVVLRKGVSSPKLKGARRLELPEETPQFGDSIRMDAAMFVSPRLKPVIEELGHALVHATNGGSMGATA